MKFCFVKRGTHLIVGVYNDHVVNQLYGMNLPVLNVHERVLSVLGCRYVDDVLIDAPHIVTLDMITTLRIDEVVKVDYDDYDQELIKARVSDMSRYHVASEVEILHRFSVNVTFRIESIIYRIKHSHSQYQAKYNRKQKAEQEYMLSLH